MAFTKAKDEAAVPPINLSWTFNAELKAARKSQDELEARLEVAEAEKTDATKNRDAALADYQESRALRAAGEPAGVDAARRRLQTAEDRLDRAAGTALITSRKLAESRAAMPGMIAQAQRSAREAYRRRYREESVALASALLGARRAVAALKNTYSAAAHIAFSPGSPEAKTYGVAAGLSGPNAGGPHGAWSSLLRNDAQPFTGGVESWARDLKAVYGEDVIEEA